MTPTTATVTREFLDPKTGQVWTLSYTRGTLGHTVRLDPPFGVACTGAKHTDDVRHARRLWRLIAANIVRQNGLVAA